MYFPTARQSTVDRPFEKKSQTLLRDLLKYSKYEALVSFELICLFIQSNSGGKYPGSNSIDSN